MDQYCPLHDVLFKSWFPHAAGTAELHGLEAQKKPRQSSSLLLAVLCP